MGRPVDAQSAKHGSDGRSAIRIGLERVARRFALCGWDSAAWFIGLSAATWFRYDGNTALINADGLIQVALVALLAHWAIAVPCRLYRGRHWTGSVDDAINVTAAMAMVCIIVFVVVQLRVVPAVPRSVPLTGALIALMLSIGARLGVRRWQERSTRPDCRSARRVIILGAGTEGRQLIRSMTTEHGSDLLPVALLDDDLALQHRRISRIEVRGTRHDLADVARELCADLLVVAAPDLDASAMHEVNQTASEAGLDVKVLPLLSERLRSGVEVADLRDLDITDLLGRQPVDDRRGGHRRLPHGASACWSPAPVDPSASELCRQIHRFEPSELIMLDRDESALHATQLSIHGRACSTRRT